MILQVNCDLTVGKMMTDNQEDWEQDDWELEDYPIIEVKGEEQKEECECEFCGDAFKDTNALRQHHRTCAPCAVALSRYQVTDTELLNALKDVFRSNNDLLNSLKIAVFSVLKNREGGYRTRHSRWLLWWMTKMALVRIGKDTTISLMDCGRLLKTNLEESVMLSKKKFCWEKESATNMWIKNFKDLLHMRKIDNLEQFVNLETAAKILAVQEELAKINHLEMVYWDAWHKSCEDAQTITRKSKGVIRKYEDGGGGFVSEQPAEVGQRTQGQVGDPRYLAGVQWCIDRRCKILGVDEATKLNIQGDANVTQEVRFDLSGLPAEILQLIAFSGDDSELAEVGET